MNYHISRGISTNQKKKKDKTTEKKCRAKREVDFHLCLLYRLLQRHLVLADQEESPSATVRALLSNAAREVLPASGARLASGKTTLSNKRWGRNGQKVVYCILRHEVINVVFHVLFW